MTTATVNHSSDERKQFFTGKFGEDAALVAFNGRNAHPNRWTFTAIETLNSDGSGARCNRSSHWD